MAMEKLYRYIQQKVTILELLLFLVVGLSASAVYLSSDGIKPAFGIYEVQEIELHKSYFRVVGRTYARSLLIDRQNQRYEGSCVGLSDTPGQPGFFCQQAAIFTLEQRERNWRSALC